MLITTYIAVHIDSTDSVAVTTEMYKIFQFQ